MPEVTKVKRCKQEHCKVHVDGHCMDTLDYQKGDCLNFYWDDASGGDELRPDDKGSPKIKGIELYDGEEMKIAGTKAITHHYATKVIAIIGEPDCGKTTLLAELYNKFQVGQLEDFIFAGSRTLIGFEKRSHLSRIESKLEKADTGKTTTPDFSFLHLALKRNSRLIDPSIHLLLSDISGERFLLARDSSTSMKELQLLTDADVIVYIIDGELLAAKKSRNQAILRAETFIQNALDNRVFTYHTRLCLIISKWDHLATDLSFNFEERIKKPFSEKFGQRLSSLRIFPIAARAKKGGVPDGFGLYELINQCCLSQKKSIYLPPKPKVVNDRREFHNRKYKEEHE